VDGGAGAGYRGSVDDSADARRRLDRAIELKAFEIACAEAIASRWSRGSNRAWLLSIFEGTLGTALAVMRGRSAGEWADRVERMRHELTELKIERRLLDHPK
jgi:hypothetical protein